MLTSNIAAVVPAAGNGSGGKGGTGAGFRLTELGAEVPLGTNGAAGPDHFAH